MRRRFSLSIAALAACCLCVGVSGALAQKADDIDWNKARQIHQKFNRGEKLTPEEQAYHDRAVKAFEAGARPARLRDRPLSRPWD